MSLLNIKFTKMGMSCGGGDLTRILWPLETCGMKPASRFDEEYLLRIGFSQANQVAFLVYIVYLVHSQSQEPEQTEVNQTKNTVHSFMNIYQNIVR